MASRYGLLAASLAPLALLFAFGSSAQTERAQTEHTPPDRLYEQEQTRELVALVTDASERIREEGESAFPDFRIADSRWRQGETYVFVLDLEGNALVHPDPEMEGRNVLGLEDVNGKPIIRGIIASATAIPDEPYGWYHYQWPIPDGILPRWKSSYARLVTAPSGKDYVVAAGMYNDRMERSFVVHMVRDAVARVEEDGRNAFPFFHDPTGPFIVKDAYIFVFDENGIDLVNPGFPNLEGRDLAELQDVQGMKVFQAMLEVVQSAGAGWVDYSWPKPGESASTQKSAYVTKAQIGDEWVLVGCGVYLADAPKTPAEEKMTASELSAFVREGAALLEEVGEAAYPQFRKNGSKWFEGDRYFFVWSIEGTRVFHAADPAIEGEDAGDSKDILGRPYGAMFLEAARSASGEGWVHYMYPEPGGIFPVWKSTFVKRVTYPSGKEHVLGCGVYNMQMDRSFIEDVVERAAALVAERGTEAFDRLRDVTGPFVFMETYVFVQATDGTELVNPAQPSLEGRNLIEFRDLEGRAVVREEIAAAMEHGSAWLQHHWFKPGDNVPALKHTYVRKVRSGRDTYVVGSGYYPEG